VFTDAQAAIDATLDAWLPSLIESNDSLIAALTRLRDFYLAGTPMPVRHPYWLMSKPPWSRLQNCEEAFNWGSTTVGTPTAGSLRSKHPVHLLLARRAVPQL
jgi:hypothetical protein